MSDPGILAQAITDNARQKQRLTWLVMFLALLVIAAASVFAMFQRDLSMKADVLRTSQVANAKVARDTNSNTNDIRETLKIARDVTSPEARAANDAALDQTLGKIDCSNRQALQEFIDQLIATGVLKASDTSLNCPTATSK